MKTAYIILSLFLLINFVCLGQISSGEIIYTGHSSLKLDTNNKKSSSLDVINKAIENNKVEFKLIFNKTESFYEIKNILSTDDLQLKIAETLLGGQRKFYTNNVSNENIKQENAYGETFIIPLAKHQWELYKETKKIGNYLCYKAITSYQITNERGKFIKNVTAWYAPEITGSYGPRGFWGLPGVILELNDDKHTFKAKQVTLEKLNLKIRKPTKGVKISSVEFNNLSKKFVR